MSRTHVTDKTPEGDLLERFDRAAEGYESWYETSRGARAAKAERRLIGFLLGSKLTKQCLLEVGCGTGYFTEWLDNQYGGAVGVDPSRGMLRELRRRNRTFPVVLGDAHRLPFGAGAFEAVVFVATLEFLDDPREALREAARVARSQVVLLWLNPWSLGALRRVLAPSDLLSQARRLSIGRVREMLVGSAGSRARGITCASALFPWPLRSVQARVPLGDVLAMRLCLAPPAAQDERRLG